MKAIINFLILFLCININIIFTTCYPYETWAKNYDFTGISKKCSWNSGIASNLTRGNTIMIKNPLGHILHPDSFFGYNSAEIKLNYERVECEFNVAAPFDHGLAVSIQQMNFDKECSNFVQLTNQDGSLNKTICDKFGGFIPRSYPGSEYLGELNLKKNNHDSSKWDVFDAEGRIHVKISVTKKHFEKLRYLFIAFTAIERGLSIDNNNADNFEKFKYSFINYTAMNRDFSSDNKDDNEKFVLPSTFYCDGIQNYKKAGDENDCDNKFMDQIIDKMVMVFGISVLILVVYVIIKNFSDCSHKKEEVNLQPTTTTANVVDIPSVSFNNNNDRELLSFGAVFGANFQQVTSTSVR